MNTPGETIYVLPFGDRNLALTTEEFQAALERGRVLAGSTATAAPPNGDARLCTAEQMEEHTGVPASWFLEAARAGTVPHHRIGKYRRFVLGEMLACLRFRGRAP